MYLGKMEMKYLMTCALKFGDGLFPEELEARVKYSMAYANQYLNFHHPSKENPIKLYGNNDNEIKYLWTALMVFGMNPPQMRCYGSNAIKIASGLNFNPKNEIDYNPKIN